MDTGLLRIFKAVAEEKSVSKAAKRLNYVQSNVTARVRQLEDVLESPLFYRKKRGMILTPAGKILLAYTHRILRLIKEAEKAVCETEAVKGPLAIGTMESTAAVRLPPVLARYHQAYPQVDLEIITGHSEMLVSKVQEYELDGAFVGGRVVHSDIEQEPMFPEELVILTAGPVRCLDTVKHTTLIVFPKGCTYRAILENWIRESGIVPRKIMEFGALEAILGCVAAGMGMTLFPLSVIKKLHYLENLNVHKISPELGEVPTMFIQRKDTVTTKALEAFLHLVRKECS